MHIKQQKLSGKATYTMFEKMRKREKLKQGRDVFSEVFLIGLWICLNFHAVDAVTVNVRSPDCYGSYIGMVSKNGSWEERRLWRDGVWNVKQPLIYNGVMSWKALKTNKSTLKRILSFIREASGHIGKQHIMLSAIAFESIYRKAVIVTWPSQIISPALSRNLCQQVVY